MNRHSVRYACTTRRSSAPDSIEIPIRLPILLATAAVSSLAIPDRANAQVSQGSIAVAAIILPAPPELAATRVTMEIGASGNARLRIMSGPSSAAPASTTFMRLSRAGERDARHAFVAQPRAPGAHTILPMPDSSSDGPIRLERLILGGT